MKGIRVLSLLDTEMNAKIGKKGAAGDFTIYSYRQGDTAVEILEPTLYPDKIHPLVFGLALSDFVVFKPDLSKKEFAETLGALITAGKPGAFLGDVSGIENYIKGSPLEGWERLDDDAIKVREKLLTVQNRWKEGNVKIIIDKVFNLKSIGVVVLGAISRGTVKVHDKLSIYPLNQPVEIKSLQHNDENVPEISGGSRVGANIKGMEAEKIERGFVLGGAGISSGKKFSAEIRCPNFVKGGIPKDRKIFAYVGLQYAEAAVSEAIGAGQAKKVEISCEKDFAFEPGEEIYLVDPGSKPRILGCGKLV